MLEKNKNEKLKEKTGNQKSEIKTEKLISVFLFFVSCVLFFSAVSFLHAQSRLSEKDRTYLHQIYSDTWKYIDTFVSDKSGLSYDSHERTPNTSITNVGFYMASVAAAYGTGLISKDEAVSKLKKTLSGVKKIELWRGFPVTWMNAETVETTEKQFSTVDHLGNFCASLVLVKNMFPEFKKEIDAVLSRMNWGIIYEPSNHFYKGGYRLDKKNFDVDQSWGKWYYSFLGADTRLGSFFGVTRKQVPMIHWESLNRGKETKYGQNYFVPGWQGGGLFMQMVSGIFMDERETVLGKSAANFAYAQILHAKKIGSPVWGWSAAVGPTGEYLGWGAIQDKVVTPHASVLTISYYPSKVIKNLKELDKLGARVPYVDNGKHQNFGFRDSINWETTQISKGYLMLDQTMLFLSLANFLYDGIVWKNFESDSIVKKGIKMIPEYSNKDADVLKVYEERDMKDPDENLTIQMNQ